MALEKQAIRFKRVYGEMFTTNDETNNETILDVGRCSDNNISKYFI